MASLFKQSHSSFWWVKFRDPSSNVIVRESTGCRHTTAAGTRQARELEAQRTLAERKSVSGRIKDAWNLWVPEFLLSKYAVGRTQERYFTAWRTLKLFLKEQQIYRPIQLTRIHCLAYPAWRQKPDHKQGKYRAGRNTALLELKILGTITQEAVWRNYIPANPVRELRLERAPRTLRPEFNDDQLARIAAAIELEPEPLRTMFRHSFLIARWHGVRRNETQLNPMTDVDLPRGLIRFKQKGGQLTTKPLHPKLRPLFEKLQAAGAKETYPAIPWGNKWTRFLRRTGMTRELPNACFHSLRVTAASRMARAGISQRKAMEYLTHASTTVHEQYVRWRPEDLTDVHDAL
jgi:integrase